MAFLGVGSRLLAAGMWAQVTGVMGLGEDHPGTLGGPLGWGAQGKSDS